MSKAKLFYGSKIRANYNIEKLNPADSTYDSIGVFNHKDLHICYIYKTEVEVDKQYNHISFDRGFFEVDPELINKLTNFCSIHGYDCIDGVGWYLVFMGVLEDRQWEYANDNTIEHIP